MADQTKNASDKRPDRNILNERAGLCKLPCVNVILLPSVGRRYVGEAKPVCGLPFCTAGRPIARVA